ncbi:hypothetical protein A1OE_616 [Candidatus Endolissoclinum faulkneri L2]|uniref:Uncharacterized protein n=1 Tax=Candidatus Endolissoclinum faulkneri L2 TaxID=1193729 RepID=K7YQG9_9PROT|nr:hypothetical protein A1OE_616 [Candidatus Endolissoclinum faulkneri L2]
MKNNIKLLLTNYRLYQNYIRLSNVLSKHYEKTIQYRYSYL